MQNLELKAYRSSDTGSKFLSDYFVEMLVQTDTYFKTNDGRLKLREQAGKNNYVIRYDREDKNIERICDYDFYPIEDVALFKKVFGGALCTEIVVTKKRMLYIYKNARIHLDFVDKLDGVFVEIEVVIRSEEDANSASELMQDLIRILDIKPEDKLSTGYRELLLKLNKN